MNVGDWYVPTAGGPLPGPRRGDDGLLTPDIPLNMHDLALNATGMYPFLFIFGIYSIYGMIFM